MGKVTVIIPNLNGKEYIRECLLSLVSQSIPDIPVIVVDNGSTDGSVELVKDEFPKVQVICLDKNYGFCRAVNEGIRAARTEFVILLNNDMKADPRFAEQLLASIQKKECIFSCQAKMLRMDEPDRIDDAGDYYCALGWAVARGKGREASLYEKREKIFSACAGAAIYRRAVFEKIGYFDERHFAYLEDVDVGYRARIAGYENWFEPSAVIWHKGSATTGARYNTFKVRHAARNNLYLIYKNMPLWQIWINLPFLAVGILIKFLFFLCKGFGPSYLSALWQGVLLARAGEKTPFLAEHFDNCCRIQLELWKNLALLLRKDE